jgi:hypothetical protein
MKTALPHTCALEKFGELSKIHILQASLLLQTIRLGKVETNETDIMETHESNFPY